MQEPDLFSLFSLNLDHNIPTRYDTITIDQLMGDNPLQKRTVIRLQLLRIVSGSNDRRKWDQSNSTFYNRSKRDKSTNASYSRTDLFREIDSTIGQVVSMIEGRSLNERLWVRNPLFHDNGMILIGTSFALLCPAHIQEKSAWKWSSYLRMSNKRHCIDSSTSFSSCLIWWSIVSNGCTCFFDQ